LKFFNTLDEYNIYQETASFVFIMAFYNLFKEGNLLLENSVKQGLYFEDSSKKIFTEQEISSLKRQMREIAGQNLPILKKNISKQDAIEIFKNRKPLVENLKMTKKKKISIYQCGDFCDYIVSPLAKSTGNLKKFDLVGFSPGIILRLPFWQTGKLYDKIDFQKKIFNAHQKYKRWLISCKMTNFFYLNQSIKSGKIKKQILMDEAKAHRDILAIASDIYKGKNTKVVLVSGPSSSGKTTFANKLEIQLLVCGLEVCVLGLDNYFLPRDKTPRKSDGSYDFESINSIDINFLNKDLQKILLGKRINLPRYNFKLGKRGKSDEFIQMKENSVLIIEGIHALNDKLTYNVPFYQKKKIYISPLFQLNLDEHNRVSSTTIRKLRRIIRDNYYRGYSAQETLERWQDIRIGEDENIFPFQEGADYIFNSALTYEIAILKKHAIGPLTNIKKSSSVYLQAQKLLSILSHILDAQDRLVPNDSIIREFIGESIYRVSK